MLNVVRGGHVRSQQKYNVPLMIDHLLYFIMNNIGFVPSCNPKSFLQSIAVNVIIELIHILTFIVQIKSIVVVF